jgi:hypothetical protein
MILGSVNASREAIVQIVILGERMFRSGSLLKAAI